VVDDLDRYHLIDHNSSTEVLTSPQAIHCIR